jgi:hypothetical protein
LIFAFSLVRCVANLLTSLFSHLSKRAPIRYMLVVCLLDQEKEIS